MGRKEGREKRRGGREKVGRRRFLKFPKNLRKKKFRKNEEKNPAKPPVPKKNKN
jgi:hypothetical protein